MSLEFKREPTMSKTMRRQYESRLVRLFKQFGKEIISQFDTAKTNSSAKTLEDETRHYDLARFSQRMDEASSAIIIQPGKTVIDDTVWKMYAAGSEWGLSRIPLAKRDNMMGPVDWRVIDALKIRNISALRKITEETAGQIIQAVTDGVRVGDHPTVIARSIKDRVENIGIVRARTMARTEVIHAFNQAAEIRYSQYGYDNWEWSTAFDERTCDICGPLDGQVFPMKGRDPRPPIHPNCRCAMLPAD